MVESMNLLSMVVPVSFQFLNGGWWVVHIFAIVVVGFIGFKIGRIKQS